MNSKYAGPWGDAPRSAWAGTCISATPRFLGSVKSCRLSGPYRDFYKPSLCQQRWHTQPWWSCKELSREVCQHTHNHALTHAHTHTHLPHHLAWWVGPGSTSSPSVLGVSPWKQLRGSLGEGPKKLRDQRLQGPVLFRTQVLEAVAVSPWGQPGEIWAEIVWVGLHPLHPSRKW